MNQKPLCFVRNLLEEIQARHSIAYMFIAHDLAVVRHLPPVWR